MIPAGAEVLVRAVVAKVWGDGDVTVAIKRPWGMQYVRVSDADLVSAPARDAGGR